MNRPIEGLRGSGQDGGRGTAVDPERNAKQDEDPAEYHNEVCDDVVDAAKDWKEVGDHVNGEDNEAEAPEEEVDTRGQEKSLALH